MMDIRTNEETIVNALRKQEPMEPKKHELGGDYYYKCHWLSCGEDINKFMNYCPKCGQKIKWETDDE